MLVLTGFSGRRNAPPGTKNAARFSHLGAGDAAGRGRSDRPHPGLPRDHRRPAAGGPAQRRGPRLPDRVRDPDRRGTGRRLAVAHALDLAPGLPHRGRAAVVLDRERDGVRRAHHAPVGDRRQGGGGARARHRGVPARDPADGRPRRDHRDGAARRARRRRHDPLWSPDRHHRGRDGGVPGRVRRRNADRARAGKTGNTVSRACSA